MRNCERRDSGRAPIGELQGFGGTNAPPLLSLKSQVMRRLFKEQ
jgi:hypothetical protein